MLIPSMAIMVFVHASSKNIAALGLKMAAKRSKPSTASVSLVNRLERRVGPTDPFHFFTG